MSRNAPRLPQIVLPGVLAAAFGCGLAACASGGSRMPVYTKAQTGQLIREQAGEVISVRDVVITDPSLGASSGKGARIGGAIGIAVITGRTERIGEVFGSLIGENIGGQFDRTAGEEIRIKLDNDEIMTVVQERDDPPYMPGEKIRIQIIPTAAVPASLGSILGRVGPGAGPVRVVRDPKFADDGRVTSMK